MRCVLQLCVVRPLSDMGCDLVRDAQRRLAAFRRQLAEGGALRVEPLRRKPGEPILGRRNLPRSREEAALGIMAEAEAALMEREIEARLSLGVGVRDEAGSTTPTDPSASMMRRGGALHDWGDSILNVTTSTAQ